CLVDDCRYSIVVRFVGVEEREQGACVDDHRSPNPARCSSASRAIGAPLENSPPRGRRRRLPTVERSESRMTSASETPRSLAARLIASLRSEGKYRVVFSMPYMVPPMVRRPAHAFPGPMVK